MLMCVRARDSFRRLLFSPLFVSKAPMRTSLYQALPSLRARGNVSVSLSVSEPGRTISTLTELIEEGLGMELPR